MGGVLGRVGYSCNSWKGEQASYAAKHMWVVKHYGKANMCENPNCNIPNPKRYEWANISREYKRERSGYKMLCPTCHKKYDSSDYCRRGHKYSESNTIIRKNGARVCGKCAKLAQERFRLKHKK